MTGPGPTTWPATARDGAVAVPALDDAGAGPPIEGDLSVAEADLARAARDFGNQEVRRPRAVLRPAGAADVAAVVRHGRRRGVPVVPRGGGHSVDGQTLVRDGIVVDTSSLVTVGVARGDRIDVAAGARWRDVLAATLPVGLVPPVLPDHLDLTVGGTLSVGGIGGTSHRYGCVADHVHDLDVVTADGDLVDCSPRRHAALFDAVRGAQGRHGVITRATLALVPAPGTVRGYELSYDDLGPFLADQRRLVDGGEVDHVLGHARHVDGVGWRYQLEVAVFDPGGPDDTVLPDGLRDDRSRRHARTVAPGDFLDRFAPVAARLREDGSWWHPHPRCTLLLPGRHAEEFVAGTLRDLGPRDVGPDGGVLLYPIPTVRLRAPNVPTARDEVTVVFGLLRTAPSGDAEALARMRRHNEELLGEVRRLGGAAYAYRRPASPPRGA
ncbi:FAD/FMN-containing dehydrogenase [Micromonospora nigra]|uniref:FAD/FMN-containing dehydrogenase n=1 Tax=Micromonospora nigra TaxID=145857 RepID=A0A1C6SZ77_9ACTN|nr:FAD-binding protein [Micromonospora nigra]SCL34523.1 FAD/FMN-containing dehydrogenase [Micromonospora nigra]